MKRILVEMSRAVCASFGSGSVGGRMLNEVSAAVVVVSHELHTEDFISRAR